MQYKDTLMWKELNEAPAVLKTLAQKNADVLAKIVQDAKDIAGVYTAARGTSDHAMIYLKYLFESILGIPVASGAPSVATVYGGKLNLKNYLVIGCSQSGKAADVMEIVKEGNECGAVTVAITNDETSPLAKLAKYHLCCFAGEEKSVAATKTFSSQLYLSLLLVTAFAGKKDGCASKIGDLLEKAVPAIDAATDPMAKDFVEADECFVLSRGVSSALAFECGLKLQETCYIRARAYHSSDFYHGPMAMVAEGTKVILFASKHSLHGGDEVHRADCRKCAEKMCELGADLYIVTDDAEAYEDLIAHIVEIPGGECEAQTVFCFALTAQMLACKTSCGKGLSPDSPRALKKVTVTK